MKENIKRQDLKQIIIDTMNDVYIDKNKLCEILEKSTWSADLEKNQKKIIEFVI